jgi:hypothetical protein
MVFCSLKYTYVGKKNIRGQAMRIGIRKIFGDLQFADWDTKEVFGLGINGLIITKFAIA